MMRRLILLVALLAMLAGLVLPPARAQKTDTASLRAVLKASWEQYQHDFIQADGRVIDHASNITTSEGQSYAMLRAVWMRDRAVFDKTYEWAKNNLQIPRGDHLFAWKWGQRPDQSWGPLDNVSASDADQDIALALLLGARIWKEPRYEQDALLILDDIWDKLTIDAPIGRVLLPGDWPKRQAVRHQTYQINPSYFAPYAYRVFAEADDNHDWEELVDSSYEILYRALSQTQTKLPPDWVEISMNDDRVRLYDDPHDPRSDYGYEAIRVYWRIGLDSLLTTEDKRPQQVMAFRNMMPRYWQIHQEMPIGLTWDGVPRRTEPESGALYGAALPGFIQQDATVAEAIVRQKILPSLKPGGPWNTRNDYYSQNWLWFGLALYTVYQDPPVLIGRQSARSSLLKLMHLPGVSY